MSKCQRIGGDFELCLNSLASKKVCTDLPLPVRMRSNIYCDSGRSAIYLALKHIKEVKNISAAWIPYYACHSVVQPFLELGYDVNFYSMGKDLSCANYLPEKPSKCVIFFIHYFGIENTSVGQYIKMLRQNGAAVEVIEDRVQCCLTNTLSHGGDYLIYSFRKFLPVPDGALLSTNEIIDDICLPPNENFVSSKILSKTLRKNSKNEQEYLSLYNSSETLLDRKIIPRKMSSYTRYVLQRIDYINVSKTRVSNWRVLSERISKVKNLCKMIQPLYTKLNGNEVPLGFPILVKCNLRDSLREYLKCKKIYCAIHWNIQPSHLSSSFRIDYDLSCELLTLPIDQRITECDIDHMVCSIVTFYHNHEVLA